MQLEQALAALAEVEEKMADYYEWLASCFAEDAEAETCFSTMAQQERVHASQVSFQHRMVRSAGVKEEVQLDSAEIRALLEKITLFQTENAEPVFSHAVLFAMRLESGAIEQAYRSLLENSSSELAKLARGMVQADEQHAQMLRDLMEQRRKG